MSNDFESLKDKHKGKTGILFATGPSLKQYKKEDFPSDYLKFAVNGVILHPEIRDTLDYYIWSSDIDIPEHKQPGFKYILEATNHLPDETKKYTTAWTNNSVIHPHFKVQTQMHPDDIQKLKGKWNMYNQNTRVFMTKNILEGLNAGSVAFQALNIMLYSGITKIILVGVDAGGGHSYKDIVENDRCDWGETGANKTLVSMWRRAKQWMEENYKDTQILSYNPVNLKDMFEIYEKVDL